MADNSVGKLIDSLLRSDLIVVDELGCAPLDAVGSQLPFRFLAAAYERRSRGVGSTAPSYGPDLSHLLRRSNSGGWRGRGVARRKPASAL